jgi:hypothetical protein
VSWPDSLITSISQELTRVAVLRRYIEEARNRLLAHYDKETVPACRPLRAFPKGANRDALEAMEVIANAFYKESFGEIIGALVTSHPGDVLDLKKGLQMGVAFNHLFHKCKNDALLELADILEKVNQEKI